MSDQTTETAEDVELLDADLVSRSIDGFEQIAIRQTFRERLDQIAADGTMFMRALLFVLAKRDGANDSDAYRTVMRLPLAAVVGRFKGGSDDDEPADEDAIAERDRAYANFVVGTRLSFTVEQYMALTLGQRDAIIAEANARGV